MMTLDEAEVLAKKLSKKGDVYLGESRNISDNDRFKLCSLVIDQGKMIMSDTWDKVLEKYGAEIGNG